MRACLLEYRLRQFVRRNVEGRSRGVNMRDPRQHMALLSNVVKYIIAYRRDCPNKERRADLPSDRLIAASKLLLIGRTPSRLNDGPLPQPLPIPLPPR